MSHARYLVGDVFERMAELPDDSVDLVLTSPPFLALRSYLPAGHPDKAKEIGSEATPAEFVDTLLRLSAEWRRVLAPHGSIAIELGDTFSGTGGAGGDWSDSPATTKARVVNGSDGGPPRRMTEVGWPQAKSLALVPEAYRFALAYGHNPHTGQQSPAGQWRIRNVIRWVRPNPPVGALGDKFRPATSEMVIATIAKDRFFDLDAVREPNPRIDEAPRVGKYADESRGPGGDSLHGPNKAMIQNPAGAPPLDWWKLSPSGYAGAHYAVWPPELCIKPIKAMCPEKVCRECGEPSRRVVGEATYERNGEPVEPHIWPSSISAGKAAHTAKRDGGVTAVRETEGWTDCGHNAWRPGLVLDPFAGTGTTLAVATGHGRDAIGIDIDSRNADLARERVGDLFLSVEEAVA